MGIGAVEEDEIAVEKRLDERDAPVKIVSGGQTGVDRAALDVALELGFPCGGYCPRGRLAEDGVIPAHYPMTEAETESYHDRTLLNVQHSDGTLILNIGRLSSGTKTTHEAAKAMGKPYLIVSLSKRPKIQLVVSWIRNAQIKTLNVAGPRESKRSGVYAKAREFLAELLTALEKE